MRKIIKKGKKEVRRFDCDDCGCVYETDEYTSYKVMGRKVNFSNYECCKAEKKV